MHWIHVYFDLNFLSLNDKSCYLHAESNAFVWIGLLDLNLKLFGQAHSSCVMLTAVGLLLR